MSALAARPTTALSIHASAVVIGEDAVLICAARSGAGKSALALALVAAARGARLFARLVADDRVLLRQPRARLIVAPHPRDRGPGRAPLCRASPIFRTRPRAVARLVVDLEPADAPGIARLPRRIRPLDELRRDPAPAARIAAIPCRRGGDDPAHARQFGGRFAGMTVRDSRDLPCHRRACEQYGAPLAGFREASRVGGEHDDHRPRPDRSWRVS